MKASREKRSEANIGFGRALMPPDLETAGKWTSRAKVENAWSRHLCYSTNRFATAYNGIIEKCMINDHF